jgi:hypothetical protein
MAAVITRVPRCLLRQRCPVNLMPAMVAPCWQPVKHCDLPLAYDGASARSRRVSQISGLAAIIGP